MTGFPSFLDRTPALPPHLRACNLVLLLSASLPGRCCGRYVFHLSSFPKAPLSSLSLPFHRLVAAILRRLFCSPLARSNKPLSSRDFSFAFLFDLHHPRFFEFKFPFSFSFRLFLKTPVPMGLFCFGFLFSPFFRINLSVRFSPPPLAAFSPLG